MVVGAREGLERAEDRRARDAHAPARILPSADDVTLIGPRVQGFAVNAYLPLPYYLLDVAAPAR